MHGSRHALVGLLGLLAVVSAAPASAADTLWNALVSAYEANPTLNASRENSLAVQENIPRAAAGYQPRISAKGEAGYKYEKTENAGAGGTTARDDPSYGVSLEVSQPLFDGFRTRNSVKQARMQDVGAREALRNTEQNTLFNAVRVYADVIANRAILDLNRRYLKALRKQLKLTRSLHDLGDVVGSEVAEVEARIAAAAAQESRAEAAVQGSIAEFVQVIGKEPRELVPAAPLAVSASGLAAATQQAMKQHPAILAAAYGVSASELEISIIEGENSPTLNLLGSTGLRNDWGSGQVGASLLAQLSIPLYNGGGVSARARQARHVTAQRELESSAIRNEVRAAVVKAWSQLQDARLRNLTTADQVRSSNAALDGIRRAYQDGERTNYEVLSAEQDLVDARIEQVVARRDLLVASYAIAMTTGTLDMTRLKGKMRLQVAQPLSESLEALAALPEPKLKTLPVKRRADACKACKKVEAAMVLRPSLEE